jgi:hypothetical protein
MTHLLCEQESPPCEPIRKEACNCAIAGLFRIVQVQLV